MSSARRYAHLSIKAGVLLRLLIICSVLLSQRECQNEDDYFISYMAVRIFRVSTVGDHIIATVRVSNEGGAILGERKNEACE